MTEGRIECQRCEWADEGPLDEVWSRARSHNIDTHADAIAARHVLDGLERRPDRRDRRDRIRDPGGGV